LNRGSTNYQRKTNKLDTLKKYFHTIKHLQNKQLFYRLASPFKKKYYRSNFDENITFNAGKLFNSHPFLNNDFTNIQTDITLGYLKFLNKQVHVGYPIRWSDINEDPLWEFNLHYMHYLDKCDHNLAENICLDWIENHKEIKGNSWHPYVCSLRIINWCKKSINNTRINKSLNRQADWLYKNIEYEVGGNHLLENARALIFSGLYFQQTDDTKKWYKFGLRLLIKELKEQTLADGVHYERSMMYHSIVLNGLLDILNILPEKNEEYHIIESICKEMMDFLYSTSHAHKCISLFNDSADGICPDAGEILKYGSKITGHQPTFKSEFPESGYYVVKDNQMQLIADFGSLGPDYLPAHSHGDIFSFELSLGDEKFITDTGVYDYNDSRERKYARSTPAHNTVCIDHTDQAEFWGRFRVARRYKPENVTHIKRNEVSKITGEFDGYSYLIGDQLVHKRQIKVEHNENRILIEDEIEGKGTHLIESYIHISPEVEIIQTDSSYILNGKNISVELIISEGKHKIIKTEFYPEFGLKKAKKAIVIGGIKSIPCKLSYQFNY
jgi:uncharacterized heparinase superfamily protein